MEIIGDTILQPMPDDERYMDEREIADMQGRRKQQDTHTRHAIAKKLREMNRHVVSATELDNFIAELEV